jgi:SAM-dependent methyltransferase
VADDLALGLRLADLYRFLLAELPPSPARLLEIGCGDGELARALAHAGYQVTAVDPRAPDGEIFRRGRFEDFSDDGGFDAVVASVSLHHIEDFAAALDKVVDLLRPGGALVLEEFAKERLSGPTARWYYHQRKALANVGDEPLPDDSERWEEAWAEGHVDVHSYAEMRPELDGRFARRFFTWTPYLYSYWLDDLLEPLERKLIADGAIQATGFRYVGEPK